MTRVLLVHGAFHGAWCWEHLQPELEIRGLPSRAVELPFTSLADDEAVTRDAIDELARTGEPVVVVGHSFGGVTISGAADEGGRGRSGVAHLVYLAALLAERGEDIDFSASPGMAALRLDGELASVDPTGAVDAFYHCAPPDLAAEAAQQLRPMPTALLMSPASGQAWRHIPSTYVICAQDRMVVPSEQRRMARRTGAAVELDCDHSPFLAMPGALADLLASIAV